MPRILYITIALIFMSCSPIIPRIGIPKQKNWHLQPPGDWKKEIIYSIMTDRFYNGDLSNDPPLSDDLRGLQGGDFKGIIEKIPYLKNLGITAVILNPIFNGSGYHGYHPYDLFKIRPNFGTEKEFSEMVEALHAANIKILFDFVANHLSHQSPIVKDHPDWFHNPQIDGVYRQYPRINFKARHNATFFGLPDLKQEREDVYSYLLSAAKFWADKKIDGFRMDAVNMIEPGFWQKFNRDLKDYAGPNLFILGESYDGELNILNKYGQFFDALFDFRAAYCIRNVFSGAWDPSSLAELLNAQKPFYVNKNLQHIPFINNHDLPRFISEYRVKNNKISKSITDKRFRQALIYLMTQPDIPYLLYGDEISLLNPPELAKFSYDSGRGQMQFKENERNINFQLIKKLIAIRRKYKLGSPLKFEVKFENNILAYYTYNSVNSAALLILHNLDKSSHTLTFKLPPQWSAGKSAIHNLLAKDAFIKISPRIKIMIKGNESKVLLLNP